MITAIAAILIFLLLVTVHELGHFVAAKACGVAVLEFALGMGPAIYKKQGKETLYSVRILPIGGYCKMEGEDEESEHKDAFSNKEPWKKLIILVSGAFMNLITGLVIMLIIYFGFKTIGTSVIKKVEPNTPAAKAGFVQGDKILAINGSRMHTFNDISFELSRYKTGTIDVVYQRNNAEKTIVLHPMEKDGRHIIGFYPKEQTLTLSSRIEYAYYDTVLMGKMIYISLFDLVMGKISPKLVSGPVGIVKEIGVAAKESIPSLLFLTSLITINLGLFNLLPLPALDGGRVLFVLIEMIRRRKVPAEKEGLVHLVGFALLILLMLYATSNDIIRLFTKQ